MRFLMVLLTVCSFYATTAKANYGVNAGQYFSAQFQVQSQCRAVVGGINMYGQRLCQNVCQVANWRRLCGAQYANAYVCNAYGNCFYMNAAQSACVWTYGWVNQASPAYYCGY